MRFQRDDFDDGGTPAWRARHRGIIEIGPPLGLEARVKRLTLLQVVLIMGLICLSPLVIVWGGIFVLVVLRLLRLA